MPQSSSTRPAHLQHPSLTSRPTLLSRPAPRRSAEAGLLPMINVVFLLLIFFLIAARLTPPEAFPVTLPDATASGTSDNGAAAEGRFTLQLGADGAVAYRTTQGLGPQIGVVLAALRSDHAAWCSTLNCGSTPPDLLIRADARAPARALPALMRAVAEMGFGTVSLAVVPR